MERRRCASLRRCIPGSLTVRWALSGHRSYRADGALGLATELAVPFVTSGIRLGTPAATSRGLKEDDFDQVAEAIAMIIKEGEPAVEKAKAIIKTLTDKYPLQPMH